MIELEETAEAPQPLNLVSAWEFVTFQPATPEESAAPAAEALPLPEADAPEEQIELADPWEFVQWSPDEPEPEEPPPDKPDEGS